MKRSFITALFITAFSVGITAQSTDPYQLLDKVKAKMDLVKDYQADITIRLSLDMLKIPAKKAKMYYKRPDKIHFETKGFALIPKKASNFQQRDVLEGEYTAIFVRHELYEGRKLSVIKVVPMDDAADVVLSTLWVDAELNQIRKVESVTRNDGSVNIQFMYGGMPFDLPKAIQIKFEVPKTELPMGITGDFDGGLEMPAEEEEGGKTKKSKGSVWVTYENYVVNAGIDDAVFAKSSKNKK